MNKPVIWVQTPYKQINCGKHSRAVAKSLLERGSASPAFPKLFAFVHKHWHADAVVSIRVTGPVTGEKVL